MVVVVILVFEDDDDDTVDDDDGDEDPSSFPKHAFVVLALFPCAFPFRPDEDLLCVQRKENAGEEVARADTPRVVFDVDDVDDRVVGLDHRWQRGAEIVEPHVSRPGTPERASWWWWSSRRFRHAQPSWSHPR